MNLKDKLIDLKKQAEDIKPMVEAGDADAMEKGAALVAEIEGVKSAIAEADKFEATLAGIGSIGSKSATATAKAAPRTLGEFAAQGVKSHGKPNRNTLNLGVFDGSKAATDVQVKPTAVTDALAQVEEGLILGKRRRLQVADLLGQETTTRSAITYFVESDTVEGGPAFVGENGKKPFMHFGDPVAVTETVKKIAAVYKESDELLDDLPWLASSIDNRGIYLVRLFEEDNILNGDGSGNNLSGILTRDGIQTEKLAKGETVAADALFRAMSKVQEATAFTADGIVMNPADYQALRLSKDANSQYYGGGYFAGQYGNGSIMEQPPVWGLRTVVTPAIAKGTALVGAFAQGAAVIRRNGLSVELANQNEDDFIHNRIAVRIEERLALAVRYPKAFVKVDLAAPAAAAARSK